jgi:putative selenate reductase
MANTPDGRGDKGETKATRPDSRCLGCPTVCEVCADVCPNRANVAIKVPGLAMEQIVHIDGMCNECGNCAVFCPYDGRPYRDKLTLFWSEEDFENSSNQGFLPLEGGDVRVRLAGTDGADPMVRDVKPGDGSLPEDISKIITAVLNDYPYLKKG